MSQTRVGFGYDIHRLVDGRPLFVGGVEIPYVKGLLGHSDGDVLLHAICDALLGAAAGLDVGECFPDTDPAYEGISSVKLLEQTIARLREKGFAVGNIDAVVLAMEPDFKPFKKAMREAIGRVLGISVDSVNIKAKTNNGLGDVGKKEAIAGYAVCVITKE
ncbi:MAG: 2-C-methyl-D-erythritol 2,4-cyclodiphosphate synthase [Candidatus Omnitrophica bacterium]|nr:2-C-methyl-D-erythritol 2,4-cyclodiphosphate synthase [Candidatus Omnitrophota bacterium]